MTDKPEFIKKGVVDLEVENDCTIKTSSDELIDKLEVNINGTKDDK